MKSMPRALAKTNRIPILSLRLLLILLAMFFITPANATYPLCSDLAGQVVGADKQPIPGARVIITHIDTGRVIVKTTNYRGRYQALNLRSDGQYRVRVEAPQGFVEFFPGEFQLGNRMIRNAVIAHPGTTDSWGWRWQMKNVVVATGIHELSMLMPFQAT